MENFDRAVATRGEVIVQAILENWERTFKVSHPHIMTLEERWAFFWNSTSPAEEGLAA